MASEHPHARDDQDLWIAQAAKNVRRCAFYMRKAIDEDNMQEALRHSAALLGELRTSLLGPQKYYELYMQANDELRSLESFFAEENSKGRSYSDLYELVQHAGNVLPRLYLLCTVGACYIRSKEAPAKPLLADMSEMCKGVQHPTRGLFLRAYLIQVCRALLPDTGSEYESVEGGDVVDAIEFLLSNFTEMNKLWVRMKLQGGNTRRDQLEKERAQLADLVGKNLTQISQLEGLTFELYRDVVLPRVLEQVVACKDELAQGYLMQCVAAAFADDFHVGTLERLLDVVPQLQPGVKLAAVMGSLLERLASYAERDASVVQELSDIDAFMKMSAAVAKSVQEHPDIPPSDLAAMYTGLLSFASAVYKNRTDYIDDVLKKCYEALTPRGQLTDTKSERQIISLLSSPLDIYPITTILSFENYSPLLTLLPPPRRREMARRIAENIITSEMVLSKVDEIDVLFDALISPLVVGIAGYEIDDDDIQEDTASIARLIRCLHNNDTDVQYRILDRVLQKVLSGGAQRAKHVLTPLSFSALETLRMVLPPPSTDGAKDMNKEKTAEDWYKLIHRAASALAECHAPELSLQVFLAAALSSSEESHLELISYECFEQAFVLFEEALPESCQEMRALHSIIGNLYRCHVFDDENRGALVYKSTAYCSKLLKKRDQCIALLACAHLYWQEEEDKEEDIDDEVSAEVGKREQQAGKDREEEEEEKEEGKSMEEEKEGINAPQTDMEKEKKKRKEEIRRVRDSKGVLSCLKRALKTAHTAQQQLALVERKNDLASGPGHLFVEILNGYIYFFDHGVDSITPDVLQNVLELTATELSTEACKDDAALQEFYRRTLDHVRDQKSGGAIERYAELQI